VSASLPPGRHGERPAPAGTACGRCQSICAPWLLAGLLHELHLGRDKVHVQSEMDVELAQDLEFARVLYRRYSTCWRTTGQCFCSTKQLSFLR
jgi:hypothetical protein